MKTLLPVIFALSILGAGCTMTQTDQQKTYTPEQKNIGTDSTSLDLSGRGLTSIPLDIFEKTGLERLDLSNNKLTGAPPSQIGHLKNLKTLDLSGNQLTGLPAELGQLDRLETLDVSDNKLTGLPMELGNLTQLKLLDLSGNAYSKQDLDQISAKLANTEIRK